MDSRLIERLEMRLLTVYCLLFTFLLWLSKEKKGTNCIDKEILIRQLTDRMKKYIIYDTR